MSEEHHICGDCKRKTCPEHGNKGWDGIAHGPTTFCPRYWPKGWSGYVFAPLWWFSNFVVNSIS